MKTAAMTEGVLILRIPPISFRRQRNRSNGSTPTTKDVLEGKKGSTNGL